MARFRRGTSRSARTPMNSESILTSQRAISWSYRIDTWRGISWFFYCESWYIIFGNRLGPKAILALLVVSDDVWGGRRRRLLHSLWWHHFYAVSLMESLIAKNRSGSGGGEGGFVRQKVFDAGLGWVERILFVRSYSDWTWISRITRIGTISRR